MKRHSEAFDARGAKTRPHRSRASVSQTSRTNEPPDLRSPLLTEKYLVKILSHLVNDGLHECHLVCRKWNKVCKKLPVQLVVDDEDRIPDRWI